MRNITMTSEPLQSIEGVLIPASSLASRKRIQDLLHQAQHNAKKIIKQANLDAQILRDSAKSAGYQAGMMMSVTSVADYLDRSQRLYEQFYTQVHERMRDHLRQALASPEVFPTLLSEWLAEINPGDNPGSLLLLIPETSPSQQSVLLAYIKTVWSGAVTLEQHQENRFVVKYQNNLAEFSPEIWIAKQQIASDYSLQLEKDCQNLSRQAKEQLLNELARRLID